MSVRQIHKHIVESAMLGWFIGLAYFNWFATHPNPLPILAHIALVTVGMYVAAIIIAAATTAVSALVTKITSGFVNGDAPMFTLALPVSTVLAFFAVPYVLDFLAPG